MQFIKPLDVRIFRTLSREIECKRDGRSALVQMNTGVTQVNGWDRKLLLGLYRCSWTNKHEFQLFGTRCTSAKQRTQPHESRRGTKTRPNTQKCCVFVEQADLCEESRSSDIDKDHSAAVDQHCLDISLGSFWSKENNRREETQHLMTFNVIFTCPNTNNLFSLLT